MKLGKSSSSSDSIICIPSRGRSTCSTTFDRFPKTPKKVFVRNDEYEEYLNLYEPTDLVRMGSNVEGIAMTKQFILDWCHRSGIRYAILADDDMILHKRKTDGTFAKMTGPCDEIASILFNIVRREGVAAVSLPGRFLANNLPRDISLYKRLACFWAVDVNAVHEANIRYGKVPVQVDLLFGLEMLLAGLPTAIYCEYAHDQEKGFGAPGGCSTFRTASVLDAASKKMAELYPNYVKVFTRKSSTFESASKDGQRTEVRVQWKKAFLSSQKG